jgi:hypothetical protein
LFSCFARPDTFSAVPRASGTVFMFCAPGHVFGGAEYVGSRFHVLCAQTRYWRYRGRRLPFSCFALPDSFSVVMGDVSPVFMICATGAHFRQYRGRRFPFSCFALHDSFSAVPSASDPVFMFCTPGLVFGGTKGVGSRFYVLLFRTHFSKYRGRGSRFHVLISRTRFRRYGG